MKGNVTRGCTYIRQRSRILLFLEHDLALCLWRTTGTQPSITHTHTLSLSAFVRANNDAIHSFLRPIGGVYILINSHDNSAQTGIHAFLAT